jgi:Xaa-Pro aminopeptidase
VVLFEFAGAAHLANHLETIDEIRPATTVSAAAADRHVPERAQRWAGELDELIRSACGPGARVGVERVYPGAANALAERGYEIVDAQLPVERARAIKTDAELACIRASVAATMVGVERLESAIRPGATENEVWAQLHAANLEHDGDYVETRLFNSGDRTNPWFQETSMRRMQAGELVALDTDVVGPYGYYSDFSRTFLCGEGQPTAHQRELYRLAYEQIHHDLELLQPGAQFRDIAARAWQIPQRYRANRYFVLAHGCGMTGEYPYILHQQDFADAGYDGTVEPGMTLCVESYIGAEDAPEGVKLEEQVLVTDDGIERLSTYPYDDRLLGTVV